MGASESVFDGSPCVHCGLCLEACPTYRLTGLEAESPRGRLYLMDAIESGRSPLDSDAARHLSSCLGCLACETACPSGVVYGRHIERMRPKLRAARARTVGAGFHWLVYRALRSSLLQRIALRFAAAFDGLGLERLRRRLPGIGLMPRRDDGRASVSQSSRTVGAPRASAALLTGCGAHVLRPSLETAVIEALVANGVLVRTIDASFCCGALDLHEGRIDEGRRLASATLARARELGVSYLVTAAAGCRAALGEAVAHGANNCTSADARVEVREVCELLVEVDFRRPARQAAGERETIAYHDACHLLHGARVTAPPRAVLEATGAAVVDLGENALCCGSAGTYNLVHRATADALGHRKAALATASGVRRIAVANLGCILQIEQALVRSGADGVRVAHPAEYLAEAYRAEGKAD